MSCLRTLGAYDRGLMGPDVSDTGLGEDDRFLLDLALLEGLDEDIAPIASVS